MKQGKTPPLAQRVVTYRWWKKMFIDYQRRPFPRFLSDAADQAVTLRANMRGGLGLFRDVGEPLVEEGSVPECSPMVDADWEIHAWADRWLEGVWRQAQRMDGALRYGQGGAKI